VQTHANDNRFARRYTSKALPEHSSRTLLDPLDEYRPKDIAY